VYDARDIVDVEDQVVVLGDGAGDLCNGHLLEGVGAANAVGNLVRDGDHWGGGESSSASVSVAMMLVASGHEVMTQTPNALHECATSVGEGVVGTTALQQLDEDVAAFARVGAAP
jgi:hypothetical protein